MSSSPGTVLVEQLAQQLEADENSILPQGGRRAFRRERALVAKARGKTLFKIADTRAFNLSNKKHGRAPDREFRPLKEKATKLARWAS